jgi:hypothetical protein
VLEWIRENLREEARLRGFDPAELTFFKRIGGDLSSGGKALFEVIAPGSPVPLWIVKATRSPEGHASLNGEFERLEHLWAVLAYELSSTVPRPVILEQRETGSLSIETSLPGEKASCLLRLHNQPDPWGTWTKVSTLALKWLCSYGECETREAFALSRDWWQRELIEPFQLHLPMLSREFPLWGTVWEAINSTADSQITRQFEVVPQHGDFTPTNLVIERDRLGVFDWSPLSPNQPPLLDLFHFLMSGSLYLGQGLEKKTSLSQLKGSVATDTQFMEPLAPLVANYCHLNAVDPEDLGPLSLAAFALKILGFVNRPEPIMDSLAGWILVTERWIANSGAIALARLLALSSPPL